MDARAYEFYGDPGRPQTSVRIASRGQAVADLGRRAILGVDLTDLLDEAMKLLNGALDADYIGFLKLLPGDQEFELHAGMGFPDGMVGATRVPAQPSTVAGRMLRSATPFIVEDFGPSDYFDS